MKNIGILGSGIVGTTLANGFIKYGYKVMIGTRSPKKLDEWNERSGENGSVGSLQETASFGEIVILAVKGTAAMDALNSLDPGSIEGKTVIDATNPISDTPPENGVLNFFTEANNSLMEELQKEFPNANFVKAFSSIGSAHMINPDFGGEKPTMFIGGNSESAKEEVKEILDLFGFETEDMGPAESARAIEPLCILWCIPGFQKNQWSHAFRLLKK
jgi:predicted dinucleotide-binding enzyme